MNVHDTIVHMMRSFPTLNENRADTLNNLFNGSHAHWENGELVLDPDSGYFDRDWRESLETPDMGDDVSERLRVLRRNAEATFIAEHANLLAQEEYSRLTRKNADTYWISGNRWNDMPEDVTDEWAAAAEESAFNAYMITKDCKKGTHGYNSHREVMKFLIARGKLNDDTRQRRIKELEEELAQLKG